MSLLKSEHNRAIMNPLQSVRSRLNIFHRPLSKFVGLLKKKIIVTRDMGVPMDLTVLAFRVDGSRPFPLAKVIAHSRATSQVWRRENR
jgi:hypothetical protein